MSKLAAAKRLRQDILKLEADPPEFIWARYKESNILLWSFLVAPPSDSVYGGGWYWGRLKFPKEYPMAPPSILMVTPSGRFATETKICLSISDFHPESWVPTLQVSTILKGALSFMLGEEETTGSVRASEGERRALAAASVAWNLAQAEFRAAFPDFDEIRTAEAARRASLARAASSARRESLVARGDFDEALVGCPAPEPLVAAREAKARGDAAFRSGDYVAAVAAYDAAPDVKCAALLRNRAAAREKLGDDRGVLADCDAALEIDKDLGLPVSFKALARRAFALDRLGRTAEAISAFQAGLRAATDDVSPAKLDDLRHRLDALLADDDPAPAPAPAPAGDATGSSRKPKKKKKKKKKKQAASPQEEEDEDDEEDRTLEGDDDEAA